MVVCKAGKNCKNSAPEPEVLVRAKRYTRKEETLTLEQESEEKRPSH